MNSDDIQETLQEEPGSPDERGPGHLLAKKREALGLSVQEIADRLHITMHYVHALETDAHDKLPGDVFIRGYLRAYAGLLDLDPTVIVNVYNDFASQREDEASSAGHRRRRHHNRNMPWIIVSGIAFVGVAFALWYFSTRPDSATPPTAAPLPRPAAQSAGVTPVPRPAVTERTPATPVAPVVPEPVNTVSRDALPEDVVTTTGTVTAVSVPSAPLDSDVSPVVADAPDSLPESPDVPVQPAETLDAFGLDDTREELADDASGASQSPLPPSPAAVAADTAAAPADEHLIAIDAGGDDVVQIRFKGESMVQVHDASEEQIYRDIRVAGDVLQISGTAPFNILLGDASTSELSLNGEKIDFSASIRIDNSARLTIGL